MANKLYEENSIRAIADRLRRFAPYSTYTVSQMADGVEGACQAQYESGRDAGMGEGIAYIKTSEARTEEDVTFELDTDNDFLPVTVSNGYYATEVVKNIDLTPICDARYDSGYADGYADGEANGGGGTDPLLEEMLIATDENYDDEGKQFYSVHKWLGVSHTNFDSAPFVLTIMNHHPTLYMHVYIEIYGAFYSEERDTYDEGQYSSCVLTIGPDGEENSIEWDCYAIDYKIEGVRWSEDGV